MAEPAVCDVCGKVERRTKKGLCSMHYSRWLRHGSVGAPQSQKSGSRIVRQGDTATITTSSGAIFLIDAEDADGCERLNWCRKADGYAHATIGGKKISLHRFLLGSALAPDAEVDHINGNPADNRKSNLRVCTHAENGRNLKKLPSRLGVTGVLRCGNKYQAHIRVNGKHKHIGVFNTIQEARQARLEAEMKYYGPFASSVSRGKWRGPCAENGGRT